MAKNALLSDYLRPFRPNTHQTDAAVRFVRTSRFQRGALLYHSMGSGKTLTTVYILENYKKGAKWLIILPKGLDTEWTGAFDQFMAGGKDPEELKAMKQNTTFLSYKDLYAMVLDVTKFKNLCDLFNDSYVVCDEAHRLLSILRSQPQQSEEDETVGSLRPLDRAFGLANRILLVTGTPVQRSFGDLSLLVNIVAGDIVSPPMDSMFKQHFGKDPNVFQKFLSVGGTVSNVIVPTVENLLKLVYLTSAATAFFGTVGSPGEVGESFMSRYTPYIYTGLYFMNAVSVVNRTYNKISIDGEKIARELGPYISYYDALKDTSMLAKTPTKKVIPIKLPMTDFQMLQFIAMAHDAGTSSLTELKIVTRISETDKIGASIRNVDAVEDFIRLGRVIGNLSPDNLAFTTERMKFNGVKRNDLKEYNYRAVFRDDCPEAIKKSNREQKPIFMCPKYNACLLELIKLRKIVSYPETYMPVVYSCFDKYGFQTFSAFLTSVNIPHLIVHPDDDILHRTAVLKMAKSPTTAWPMNIDKVGNLDPLCVLIHPTLTEGLSFSFNPAIFVLEMPFGYGVQEQIYARVIRTLSNQDVLTYGLTNVKRFAKKIYQFSSNNGHTFELTKTNIGKSYGLQDINIPTYLMPLKLQTPTEAEKWGILTEFKFKGRLFPETNTIPGSVDLNATETVFSKEIDKDMSDYVRIYYPKLKFFFRWVEYAPYLSTLYNEPKLGKSSKDFVTQYLEDFKFGADQTPDQWAAKVNAQQEFQLTTLTEALSVERQKDANAPRPPEIAVPYDIKNAPPQILAKIPLDIFECSLYDPTHPNDPECCNLKSMTINGENLLEPEQPKAKKIIREREGTPFLQLQETDEEGSDDESTAEDDVEEDMLLAEDTRGSKRKH